MTITESTSSAVIPPRLVVPGTGITVTGITGTYTNVTYASGMGYYTDGPLGIADGIIISNGYASSALPPSDYGSTSGILGLPGNPLVNTILGYSATSYDAVSFRITFDVDPGINSVMFDFIFGSEEFPEYVGASVNDAFGVFLNGVQIVHDEYGQPLTINAAYFSVVEPATGLEYDGSTAKLNTAAAVTPGSTGNVIEFVIADVADSIYDSGALLARLRGSPMSVTTPVTVPDTPTVTPTHTDSPTYTHTATATPTYTQTPTFTFTLTHTLTHTMTPTPTYTATPTFTCTYTATPTFTFTLTATPTVTVTHTPTITPTATATVTMTPTPPPLVLDLKGNFPNPFIKETQIVFWLSRQAACKIKVFTVSGEVVREEQGINGLAGYNAWYWDGKNRAVKPVASGIFIYRVEAFTETGEHAEAYAKAAAAK